MVKIVTACLVGLVRSVGLADVLKCHYTNTDVVPVGLGSNSQETLAMLLQWSDWFIIMEEHYRDKVPRLVKDSYYPHQYDDTNWVDSADKIVCCDVGPDRYGGHGCGSHHPELLNQCFKWVSANEKRLGITHK